MYLFVTRLLIYFQHVCSGKFFPREGSLSYHSDGSGYEASVDWQDRQDGDNTVQGFMFDVRYKNAMYVILCVVAS